MDGILCSNFLKKISQGQLNIFTYRYMQQLQLETNNYINYPSPSTGFRRQTVLQVCHHMQYKPCLQSNTEMIYSLSQITIY
jgi:hypothetical protein